MRYLFFLILFYIIIISCQSCNNSDLIFNFGSSQLQDEGWNVLINSKMRIDSTEKVNGKYPLVIEQTEYLTNIPYQAPFSVLFYRQVLFPDLPQNTNITISISSKSLNLSTALLKFFCIDEDDNIVFCDSIHLNEKKNSWSTKSISFSANKTQRIILGVYALGYDLPSPEAINPQKLWLDKIIIRTNNNQTIRFDNRQLTMQEKINLDHSIELISPFDQCLSKICIPDNKMIIGIGEAVHGSKTINQIKVEFVKNMILHNSCKLVLFELDMFQLMTWNQFIQGKTSEEYIHEIKRDLSLTLFSPEIVGDFLIWLRNYNGTSNKKIYIQGVIDYEYGWENYLFHYAYTFYDNSTASTINPLLKKLRMQTLPEALSYVQESKVSLETIMGNKEFANFLYALEKAIDNNTSSRNINSMNIMHQKLLSRDISMADNVNRFVSSYLQNGQKACIIAHNGHVKKKNDPVTFPYLYSMGHYLNQRYGDKYYVLGIFPGEGSMSVISDGISKETYLNPISFHSLEYACLQTRLTTFFYSTKYLKNDFLYYRSIGNHYSTEEYEYGNLKTQMDGFIYVDKIYPIHSGSYNMEKNIHMMEKMKKEIDVLRTIQK